MTKSSSKKGVQLVVNHFKKLGIKHLIFSPGSRNAPLVIGFNADDYFESIVIPDERSAGFYALGMAQQLNEPVVLICTSGSALLNYYPAVAEAFYQNIPLIVLSADRPIDWVDQGDGQTIRQEQVLKNHVRYYTSLRENHSTTDDAWFNAREITTAYHACNGLVKGPVHINFPLSEPLYDQSEVDETIEAMQPALILDGKPVVASEHHAELKSVWKTTDKVLILVGQHRPNEIVLNALKNLNTFPNVAIVAENTSNMIDRDFVNCIDRTLDGISAEERAEYAPDLLITVGGAIVSKKIKQYFRTHPPKHHWRVGENFPYMDTYQAMTKSFVVEASEFLQLIEAFPSESHSNFGNKWKQKDFLQEEKTRNYLAMSDTYSDLKVYELLLDCVPDDSNLHLANSSVIRYSQLFTPIRFIKYWANRGTSGIDGSMSTVAGACVATPKNLHTLIIGDLSFFYDSNALWNQLKLSNLRVFLINNGGGDIFNIIPGPATTAQLNENFVYKQTISAEGLCQTFGVRYFKAHSLEEIEAQMHEFYSMKEDGAYVMEIFTDKVNNSEELKKFLKI